MPNGLHGSAAEWERLENPLHRLDDVLEQFARRHDLTLIKNERNWPDRTFRWGNLPCKLIQLFLETEAEPSYTVWVSAYDDRDRAKYWKHKTLVKSASIESLTQQLPRLLAEAIQVAEQWEKAYEIG